jgi:hypothetical protein
MAAKKDTWDESHWLAYGSIIATALLVWLSVKDAKHDNAVSFERMMLRHFEHKNTLRKYSTIDNLVVMRRRDARALQISDDVGLMNEFDIAVEASRLSEDTTQHSMHALHFHRAIKFHEWMMSWEAAMKQDIQVLRTEHEHSHTVYDLSRLKARLKYRKEVAAMLSSAKERENVEFLWRQADLEGVGHITVYEFLKVRAELRCCYLLNACIHLAMRLTNCPHINCPLTNCPHTNPSSSSTACCHDLWTPSCPRRRRSCCQWGGGHQQAWCGL